MSAIERIMKAYASKHALNPEQAVLVRAEISRFIDELMSGKPQASSVTPDMNAALSQHPVRETATENPPLVPR